MFQRLFNAADFALFGLPAFVFLLLMQISFATPTMSAEFELVLDRHAGGHVVTLDGTIEIGDADQFRSIMQRAILLPGINRLRISLDSPGGNVSEAIEIGRIVRAALAETWTSSTIVWLRRQESEVRNLRYAGQKFAFADLDEPLPAMSRCLSACTIIFYSGIRRSVFDNSDSRASSADPSMRSTYYPTLGVHRPIYDPEEYGQLSPAEAQEAYSRMLQDVADVLSDMGAPDEFIERTMATPSTEIDMIPDNSEWFDGPDIEPFFVDWLVAKCGGYTDTLDDAELRLYQRYKQVLDQQTQLFKDDKYEEWLAWNVNEAVAEEFGSSRPPQLIAINSKVNNWTWWVDLCKDLTVLNVRHDWATEPTLNNAQ